MKFGRFLDYVQTRQLMEESKLKRSVHQFRAFDRRLGQLASFLGYIRPEQINDILMDKCKTGRRFGECAIRLKLLTPQQIERLVGLQRDDISLFSQAVGIQNAASPVEFTSFLTDFMRHDPQATADEPPEFGTEIDEKILSILRRVEHISPLPGIVEKAAEMLADPEVQLDEVSKVLKIDPALTTTLLRVSNSAFYGLRSKIGSVKKALHVLGTDKLRQLIIVAGIMQKFQTVPNDYLRRFWEQSLRTAECSKEIGKYCRIPELDELFVCGLLHNIGELVMKQFFPSQAASVETLSRENRNRLEVEREAFGGTHADVGGFLFHIWKLPRNTIQSTMFHHHDFNLLVHTPDIAEEVYIVHMAAALCSIGPELNAYEYARAVEAIGGFYSRRLKFPPSLDFNSLMMRVDASIEELDKNYFK